MTETDAMNLQCHLLNLAKSGDAAALEAENLPPAALMLLRKITGLNAEIHALEGIVERREAEVDQLDAVLLQQLQQLP
jgi:hypothetical protein